MNRDVWRVTRAGSLDRLVLRSEPLPPPAPGEARIGVRAIGLNLADVFACLGLYSATPKGSFIPGLEFAGVIEEFGQAADSRGHVAPSNLRPGDYVFGVTRFGAYATTLNARVDLLTSVPSAWDFAQAAAFPAQALTAWYGLIELARVQRDELVLVHSAAGGVGLNALAILRAIGARLVATVGRDEKKRFLADQVHLPEESIIVRDRRRFGEQLDRVLAAAQTDGLDCVFDAIGGPFLEPSFSRLRPRGRLVVYGASDFMPRGRNALDPRLLTRYVSRPRIDPMSLMTQNRSVMGFNLIWLWDQAHRLPDAYATLLRMYSAPPFVGRKFPFEEAPAALAFLKSGESVGKIVLERA